MPQSDPSGGARPALELPEGVEVVGESRGGDEQVLRREVLQLVAELERTFGARRRELLGAREERQARLDDGWLPDFPAESRDVRERAWKVAPPPADLVDRTVEITGPVDRKMIVNALNSGADVFMADFEDASSPTWRNCVDGQRNVRDAVRREIDFTHPETGKEYRLGERTATLVVRPRGWHLEEKHVRVDGRPVSASLFDVAVFLANGAHEALARGTGPYLYLPKLEGRAEAALWRDVLAHLEDALDLRRGTVRATVLIETILAAFEMDEILWELRERSTGLNCGRWDFIFSFVKRFRARPEFVLPDRGRVGMERHFLRSYSRLLVRTCHRRGAHAMGGMAAQIPVKHDEAANRIALEKVRADKRREVGDGHDGTWVAHPGLVEVARAAFREEMRGPNQLDRVPDVRVGAPDLLRVPDGAITEEGLRTNLAVGVIYLEAWLSGNGCVPIRGLMEDAATAEISRTQVWQWIRHGARLDDGRTVDRDLVRRALAEELEVVAAEVGPDRYRDGRFPLAAELFERLVVADELAEFLTLVAYEHL